MLSQPDRCSNIPTLRNVYGDIIQDRIPLLKKTLECFFEHFGDQPVLIVRSPGRINLRGMHIDTHGGFLNLMTTEQEVVLVCQPREDTTLQIYNVHENVHSPLLGKTTDTCQTDNIRKEEHWHKYVYGVISNVLNLYPGKTCGMNAVVGSDLPEGSALSSSHALCNVILLGYLFCNSITSLTVDTQIRLVQQAEWFAGARSGLSDQTAELLGIRNAVLGVLVHPQTGKILFKQCVSLPSNVAILVADSKTRRDISSTHAKDYVQNRFAYSVAMHILKQALLQCGCKNGEEFQLLMDFTPERLGGLDTLFQLFSVIPQTTSIEELFRQFPHPSIREAFDTYFGHLPESEHPQKISLRGPIVYGVCETIRAFKFFESLHTGDVVFAGYLMNLGHNGDRVIDSMGNPYHRVVTDDVLQIYRDLQIAPETLGGDYGASTPILDRLVDVAIQAGALGACLTGAGLGGVTLSLCLHNDIERVRSALVTWLSSDEYAQWSKTGQKLTREEAEQAVFVHRSVQGASYLPFPG